MKIAPLSSLLLILTGATAFAVPNGGLKSMSSVSRQLNPYSHEQLLGDITGFSIEGVSIAKANLTVTQTTDSNCGSAEYGYQGCTQNEYVSEPAVEVRVSVNSSHTSSDQPSSGQWRVFFHLSDFTQAELNSIQQNSRTFDPFGSATVRSRDLARRLFAVSTGKTTLRWKEPVFGNVCTSSTSAGEHNETKCNVIGERSRSRVADTLQIVRK